MPDGTKHACLPPGSYTVTITSESAQAATLSVGAGATLSLETATCGAAGALLTLHGPMSNAGTVELAPCDGTAHIVVPPGVALTNDGTISVTGNLGDRVLSGIVTNNGTVSFNTTTGQAHLDGAALFDNHGNVTIADGAKPTISGGAGYSFHNGASGSVVAAGSGRLVVESGNAFDEGQGGVSGNPVLLTGGSTLSFSGNGASSFVLHGANTLLGTTIAASQTVNIDASGCSPATTVAQLANSMSNAGTIRLRNPSACTGTARLLIPSGSTLTNDGTITAEDGSGNGSLELVGGGVLDNLGNMTVFDATTLTNVDERLAIESPNGTVTLSGNTAKLVHLAAATLGVTVDAENGQSTRIQGGRFAIDGALEVTTLGTPGTPWSFFSGVQRVGQFASSRLGEQVYTIGYSSNTATLSPGGLFTTQVIDDATGLPPSGATAGASVHDTALVPGVDGLFPSGTVAYSFFHNGTCAGAPATTEEVALDDHGLAPPSSPTGPLGAGSYSYRADYGGDMNYGSNTSACEPFTVGPAPSPPPPPPPPPAPPPPPPPPPSPPPPPPVVRCGVPKVVGKRLKAAAAKIRAAHCSVGKITRKRTTKAKRGRVIAQSPRPGTRLRNHAKVKLTVGR